ncbi:uncharacterized protein BDR25DRAFT_80915 [Lindgomyces ingoldianus]|uniref:Uncharacterized protein n=1 Tax=Lindgomyces ingoldianus TaxID=673940 RepID=A0ACB6QFY6_9PLEO|nr:uncharacterized protein BDR25DRAFT_80915 [Lindgomyces ingoldianus]KAF2465904.1 hypothetical protein BDR25DRAFT_80915 [Lindgomyces ingoldianus]
MSLMLWIVTLFKFSFWVFCEFGSHTWLMREASRKRPPSGTLGPRDSAFVFTIPRKGPCLGLWALCRAEKARYCPFPRLYADLVIVGFHALRR